MTRVIISIVCIVVFVILCAINPQYFVLNGIISAFLLYTLDDIFYVPKQEREDERY
jgi:hypothetical protein